MPTGLDAALEGEPVLTPARGAARNGSPTDETIIRILGGDTEAFEALLVQVEPKILAFAYRYLGDRDQARDVTQEVFLRVYRSLGSFRLGESFQAWVYRIAANVCADHARKRGLVLEYTGVLENPDPGPTREPHAEEVLLRAEQRAMVRKALATLPPAERSALLLRDLEGYSTEEVARILGVRAVTIRGQLASARAKVQVFCTGLLRRAGGGRS